MHNEPSSTIATETNHERCHRLMQPISVTQAYADLLADEVSGPLNDAQRGQLETLLAATHKLTSYIEDIHLADGNKSPLAGDR